MSELITGAGGQLGRALASQFPEAIATTREELDIADKESVEAFDFSSIDTIINAAAYTKVDEAETPDGKVAAYAANRDGVANLAAIAGERELTLVHISTDYVFDGNKQEPYREDDPINPLSVYGQSKAEGEKLAANVAKHYIIRTSWVVGDGGNFVKTMMSLAEKDIDPSVVNDQFGRPTFTVDLARVIDHLLRVAPEPGTYHFSNAGEVISWADLAKEVFFAAGYDAKRVSGTTTAEYFAGKEGVAPRPKNSVFDLSKIESTGFLNRHWREALVEYVEQELAN
ncbi:MAG: dTDP-4-dehydrorhamnose reductase [Candidatus Saccharimonadales bacterium]